jgi:hypothetical protein
VEASIAQYRFVSVRLKWNSRWLSANAASYLGGLLECNSLALAAHEQTTVGAALGLVGESFGLEKLLFGG